MSATESAVPRYGGRDFALWADDAIRLGSAHRSVVPRRSHTHYEQGDRDPVAIVQEQNKTRLPDLVDLRMRRMAASPFAFFRGTAAIMAADLARGVSTGIDVVACGDAHLSNFGFFASPSRTLVFDLNDFDEAAPAPWEWDVKRLVTSAIIGARDLGFSDEEAISAGRRAAAGYRRAIREMVMLDAADRYYLRHDTTVMRRELDSSGQVVLDRAVAQARRRTSRQFVQKVTVRGDDGKLRFVPDPPVLQAIPVEDRLDVEQIFREYQGTALADIGLLLSQHELTDTARRVVGVGSVGTRCFVLLLTGPHHEAMVLQVKEAPPSVLKTYGGARARTLAEGAVEVHSNSGGHDGRRVVNNQRILQAVSDLMLGYVSFNDRNFYVRQFRDMKGSVELERLNARQFGTYARGCGTVLARAHAQSANSALIAGYLGNSTVFDEAVVSWGMEYADQSRQDYDKLTASLA